MSSNHDPGKAGSQRGPALAVRLGTAAGLIESVGLLGYGIAIGVYAVSTGHGRISVAPVLVGLYAVFALLLGFVARGLGQGRRWSRTPFILAQVFALIVGYTLLRGTGAVPHIVGLVVGALGLVGAGSGVSRQVGDHIELANNAT